MKAEQKTQVATVELTVEDYQKIVDEKEAKILALQAIIDAQ